MNDVMAPPEELQVRALAYRILATLYLTEPDAALLAYLAREGLLEAFPAPDLPGETRTGLAHLRAASRRLLGPDGASEAAAIRRDYFSLFAGPGHVPAPPWESVYRSEEHLLFDWPTDAVRQVYRSMSLRPGSSRDADDHVGLELLFVALMDERMASGDPAAETTRRRFVQDHPRQWLPSFCRDVEAAAATDFWRGVALLTAGILAQEA